ncbi:hypothetical protein SAMN04487819_11660 [Actinopolyspora alba]|uniref:Uncharacterized protein n=1 Tax=Actinopolyspora alba TaxID=673379 RepID=A0A1I2BH29_9ACTN|nr:hypothetical protein [Actinopolyspora alba]SFE54490.1 hypothetical protein SAMN04487819_11660 [Actinopolyspora alba]
MATISHVEPGSVASSTHQNGLIDQLNANTDDIAANNSRIITVEDRLNLYSNAGDDARYGDQISSMTRFGRSIEPLSNGYLTMVAAISPQAVTVSEVRLGVNVAADNTSGTGDFEMRFYTGPDTNTLTAVTATFTDVDAVTSNQLAVIALPSSVSLSRGQVVALGMRATGYDAAPSLTSTSPATGMQPIINPEPTVYSCFAQTTNAIGSSANMASSFWTSSNQIYWFALA